MLAQEIASAIQGTLSEALQLSAAESSLRKYVGEHQQQLSQDLCLLTEQQECCLFSSATAGLEVTLRALQIGPEDEVLLAGYDYPGNFWAVERVGAKPVLVDVEPEGWCLNLSEVEDALRRPNRIKALVASHLYGQLQDMVAILELCHSHGIRLIEDCCQVIGAQDRSGQPVGKLADAMLISFGGGKTISCGRGGALLTSDADLAQRIRVASGAGSGAYALSELQALMVRAQLPYLQQIHGRCRQALGAIQTQFISKADPTAHPANPIPTNPIPSMSVSCPSIPCLDSTAYYQFGWLLRYVDPPEDPSNASFAPLVDRLNQAGYSAGRGFPGFHRRSERRCRKVSPLINTSRRTGETLVIHHEFALRSDEQVSLAGEILTSQLRT